MIRVDNKILITRPFLPTYDEYIEEIRDIWESKWLTNMGKKSIELQKILEEYLEVENADLVVNGHTSIELTLQALQLKGEVITTPFTFVSTTHAIVRSGLTPVFCDIDPNNYTMDVNKIEELITDKTSAILPVHVYGNVCDVERIQDIADKHHLKVIYDASHAFGVKYCGKGVASYGDVSCISMHATKVFHTIEGGVVCYKDESFGDKIKSMKNFGIVSQDEVGYIGSNGKMNEFCAAMGLCNMKYIDYILAQRKRCVEQYRTELQDIEGIQLNVVKDEVEENYAYFPVLFDEEVFSGGRDAVLTKLQENGISARKYFYPLTSEMGCYKHKFDSSSTPIAHDVSMRVLTLPLYAELKEEEISLICEIIRLCKY